MIGSDSSSAPRRDNHAGRWDWKRRTARGKGKNGRALRAKRCKGLGASGARSERYDRSKKLEQYMQGATIEAIVLVSHRSHVVEVWTRTGAGWAHTQAAVGEHAAIAPIDCSIDVDRLYGAAGGVAG